MQTKGLPRFGKDLDLPGEGRFFTQVSNLAVSEEIACLQKVNFTFGVDLLAFSTTSGTKRKYNYFFWISRNDDSMASEMEKQVFASWLSNFFVSFVDVAYAPVRDYLGAGPDAPFYMKFLAGAITGGVGSVVGMSFCCWVFSLFLFRLSFSSKSWQ